MPKKINELPPKLKDLLINLGLNAELDIDTPQMPTTTANADAKYPDENNNQWRFGTTKIPQTALAWLVQAYCWTLKNKTRNPIFSNSTDRVVILKHIQQLITEGADPNEICRSYQMEDNIEIMGQGNANIFVFVHHQQKLEKQFDQEQDSKSVNKRLPVLSDIIIQCPNLNPNIPFVEHRSKFFNSAQQFSFGLNKSNELMEDLTNILLQHPELEINIALVSEHLFLHPNQNLITLLNNHGFLIHFDFSKLNELVRDQIKNITQNELEIEQKVKIDNLKKNLFETIKNLFNNSQVFPFNFKQLFEFYYYCMENDRFDDENTINEVLTNLKNAIALFFCLQDSKALENLQDELDELDEKSVYDFIKDHLNQIITSISSWKEKSAEAIYLKDLVTDHKNNQFDLMQSLSEHKFDFSQEVTATQTIFLEKEIKITPLEFAIRTKNTLLVQALMMNRKVQVQVANNLTLLLAAIRFKCLAIIKVLLNSGIYQNHQEIMTHALEAKNYENPQERYAVIKVLLDAPKLGKKLANKTIFEIFFKACQLQDRNLMIVLLREIRTRIPKILEEFTKIHDSRNSITKSEWMQNILTAFNQEFANEPGIDKIPVYYVQFFWKWINAARLALVPDLKAEPNLTRADCTALMEFYSHLATKAYIADQYDAALSNAVLAIQTIQSIPVLLNSDLKGEDCIALCCLHMFCFKVYQSQENYFASLRSLNKSRQVMLNYNKLNGSNIFGDGIRQVNKLFLKSINTTIKPKEEQVLIDLFSESKTENKADNSSTPLCEPAIFAFDSFCSQILSDNENEEHFLTLIHCQFFIAENYQQQHPANEDRAHHHYQQAFNLFLKMLYSESFTAEIESELTRLFFVLFKQHINQIKKLLQQNEEKAHEQISVFISNAMLLHDKWKESYVNEAPFADESEIQSALTNQVNQYLHFAKKLLSEGKLKETDDYLINALQIEENFRDRYKEPISIDTESSDIYEQYVNQQLRVAEELLKKGNHEEAFNSINSAMRIYDCYYDQRKIFLPIKNDLALLYNICFSQYFAATNVCIQKKECSQALFCITKLISIFLNCINRKLKFPHKFEDFVANISQLMIEMKDIENGIYSQNLYDLLERLICQHHKIFVPEAKNQDGPQILLEFYQNAINPLIEKCEKEPTATNIENLARSYLYKLAICHFALKSTDFKGAQDRSACNLALVVFAIKHEEELKNFKRVWSAIINYTAPLLLCKFDNLDTKYSLILGFVLASDNSNLFANFDDALKYTLAEKDILQEKCNKKGVSHKDRFLLARFSYLAAIIQLRKKNYIDAKRLLDAAANVVNVINSLLLKAKPLQVPTADSKENNQDNFKIPKEFIANLDKAMSEATTHLARLNSDKNKPEEKINKRQRKKATPSSHSQVTASFSLHNEFIKTLHYLELFESKFAELANLIVRNLKIIDEIPDQPNQSDSRNFSRTKKKWQLNAKEVNVDAQKDLKEENCEPTSWIEFEKENRLAEASKRKKLNLCKEISPKKLVQLKALLGKINQAHSDTTEIDLTEAKSLRDFLDHQYDLIVKISGDLEEIVRIVAPKTKTRPTSSVLNPQNDAGDAKAVCHSPPQTSHITSSNDSKNGIKDNNLSLNIPSQDNKASSPILSSFNLNQENQFPEEKLSVEDHKVENSSYSVKKVVDEEIHEDSSVAQELIAANSPVSQPNSSTLVNFDENASSLERDPSTPALANPAILAGLTEQNDRSSTAEIYHTTPSMNLKSLNQVEDSKLSVSTTFIDRKSSVPPSSPASASFFSPSKSRRLRRKPKSESANRQNPTVATLPLDLPEHQLPQSSLPVNVRDAKTIQSPSVNPSQEQDLESDQPGLLLESSFFEQNNLPATELSQPSLPTPLRDAKTIPSPSVNPSQTADLKDEQPGLLVGLSFFEQQDITIKRNNLLQALSEFAKVADPSLAAMCADFAKKVNDFSTPEGTIKSRSC